MRPHPDQILGKRGDSGSGHHAPERITQFALDAAPPGTIETRPDTLAHALSPAGSRRLANRLSNADALARFPGCGDASRMAT